MEENRNAILEFYTTERLYESILEAFKKNGLRPEKITRSHLLPVDEFHILGAKATREIVADAGLHAGMKVLDAGCGIGGTCRLLADQFGCHATGVDLSEEYVRTARLLSNLLNMNQRTRFMQADVCHIPLENDSFDAVVTQHVQMNVEDKTRFISELTRLLKPGGILIYYDVFRIGELEIQYPVPWASTPEQSFLTDSDSWDRNMEQCGLTTVSRENRTAVSIQFLYELLKKIREGTLPRPGLDLLMGATYSQKITNVYENLIQGKIILQSGIVRKESA